MPNAAAAASDKALFPYFQDIIELCHAEDSGDTPIAFDEDGLSEEQCPSLDASSFPMDAIQSELKKRHLKASGFFNEDAALLQEQFDQELEQAREEKRQQRIANQERLERERRDAIIQKEMLLERQELDHDQELSTLLSAMKKGKSPHYACIELKLTTSRSLAFGFCSPHCNLVHLDVSNQGLCDLAGAYLCRSLAKNTSLKKIELSKNRLGTKSFQELGRGLMTNTAIEYVSLDCNPLARAGSGSGAEEEGNLLAAARPLADMIGRNKTLRHLGLWQCFMGAEGGRLIASALETSNTTLTALKCGYNNWDDVSIRKIETKLESNREARNREREIETARRKEEEMRRLEQERLDEEIKCKLDNEQWLEDQKKIRAEQRRLQMEAEKRARIEREKAEEEECQRLAAEEAAMLAAKKAKTKKKKAKKKK